MSVQVPGWDLDEYKLLLQLLGVLLIGIIILYIILSSRGEKKTTGECNVYLLLLLDPHTGRCSFYRVHCVVSDRSLLQ